MQNGVSQIFLEGRFDANTSGDVEKILHERIEEGTNRFILNLEKVPFVASAGLRVVLVIARKLRQESGGDLRIASLQPNVNKVFQISGLDNFLRIFDSTEKAMDSYNQ